MQVAVRIRDALLEWNHGPLHVAIIRIGCNGHTRFVAARPLHRQMGFLRNPDQGRLAAGRRNLKNIVAIRADFRPRLITRLSRPVAIGQAAVGPVGIAGQALHIRGQSGAASHARRIFGPGQCAVDAFGAAGGTAIFSIDRGAAGSRVKRNPRRRIASFRFDSAFQDQAAGAIQGIGVNRRTQLGDDKVGVLIRALARTLTRALTRALTRGKLSGSRRCGARQSGKRQ